MDVKCEKCNTEYSLDETLVSPSGTSVRCTTCNNIFKAFPSSVDAGSSQTWILHQAGGATFPFDRMGTLQDWINTGKVSPNDQLSRGDGTLKRLSDIAEMKSFFDAAQMARASRSNVIPVAAGFPGAPEKSAHMSTIKIQPYAQMKASDESVVRSQQVSSPAKITSKVDTIPPPPMNPTAKSGAVSSAWAATQVQGHSPDIVSTSVIAQGATLPQMNMPDISEMQTMKASASQASVSVQSATPRNRNVDLDTLAGTPQPTAHEHMFSQIPASQPEQTWESGTDVQVDAGPAWAEKDLLLPTAVEDEFVKARPKSKRKTGRWIALFVVLGLIGGAFYLFMYQKEVLERTLGDAVSKPDLDRYETFFIKGRENFLLDTEAAFVQADREYHQVLALQEHHALTLAALAEMNAVWAQYLRDQEIDLRTDAVIEKSTDLREAEKLNRTTRKKIAEAVRWADQALLSDPKLPEAHLAKADLDRLLGDMPAAELELAKGHSAKNKAALGYVAALINIEKGVSAVQIQKELGDVVSSKPMLRALYRLARVDAESGENELAKKSINKILELNAKHSQARDLLARIDSGNKVLLLLDNLSNESSDTDNDDAKDIASEASAQPLILAETSKQKHARIDDSNKEPVKGRSTDAMLVRAKRLQENNRAGEAMKIYKKVLDSLPSNIDALSGLGYCYMDRGAGGQAIALFRRALNINGAFAPALIGTALTYKRQGQKNQALKWFKKYLAMHPNSKHSAMARANVKQLEGALSKEVITISDSPAPENTGDTKPTESTSTESSPKAPALKPVSASDKPPAPAKKPSETE